MFQDTQYGAAIKLLDYEHIDYIDDVLIEKFDVDCEFRVMDDENQKYILYFGSKFSFDEVSSVVSQINAYHQVEQNYMKQFSSAPNNQIKSLTTSPGTHTRGAASPLCPTCPRPFLESYTLQEAW